MRLHVLETWAKRESVPHRRDPRAKILLLLVFLVCVAAAPLRVWLAGFAIFGVAAIAAARLPLWGVLSRAAVIFPFTLTFAAITWLDGNPLKALGMMAKSYISAVAALTLVSTTTLPDLLRGMELLGMPAILVRVIQFLYRYLFVLVDQGYRMRQAALCRGNGWPSAAGALTVLFARSYGRAEAIQRSMLARGYCGHFPALSPLRFGAADWLFLAAGAAGPLALCVAGAYEASY